MADIRREQLNMLFKPVLKALCTERGLAVGGRNEELVNRILVHEGHARPEGDLRFMTKAEVAALPDETIFSAVERFGDGQLSAVPNKRKQDKAFVTGACEKDPKSFKHFHTLASNPTFCKELFSKVPGAFQFASQEIRADPELASIAIHQNPRLFLSASPVLKNDPSFVLPLLAKKPTQPEDFTLQPADLFVYAGDKLRTPEACLLAARNCSWHHSQSVLRHMPGVALSDPVTMAHLIKKEPSSVRYVGENLKASLSYAKKVASLNGEVLPYLPMTFQTDPDVVITALVQCPKMTLRSTLLVDPYLARVRNIERKYLTSKDNVHQFLCLLGSKTAMAHLGGNPRVKFTIVSYLMNITTHPYQNAMTLALRAKMRHIIGQLERAAHIQAASRP